MDDKGFEYTVIIRDGKFVSAMARDADGEGPDIPEREIDRDKLKLRTIRILQDWLNRWGVLTRFAAQYDKLRVPGTFELLGEHLYELIFADDVGKRFDDAKKDADGSRAPLRLVLRFEQDDPEADDLASLPWEFLYHPEGTGHQGYFIAVETNLALSRRIKSGQAPLELPKGTLPLRVLFIVSTPSSLADAQRPLGIVVDEELEKEYSADRNTLLNFLVEFQSDTSLLTVQTVATWNPTRISTALARKPCFNIIHVVGICQSVPGDVELLLEENGVPGWRSSQDLVDLLSEGSRDGYPGLVVLHLCEARRSDYTATFERLAPKLVRAGFPAVLAMQYPLPASDATRFAEKFYQLLTAGTEIGQAVQDARRSLLNLSRTERFFATPVLYLQSVDGQLLQAATSSPESGGVVDMLRSRPEPLAEKLLQVVTNAAPDKATALAFTKWVKATEWTGDRATAEQLILTRMLEDSSQTRHGPVYNKMLEVVQERGGAR